MALTLLVSIREQLESLESLVIPMWRCDSAGAAGCRRTTIAVNMYAATFDIQATSTDDERISQLIPPAKKADNERILKMSVGSYNWFVSVLEHQAAMGVHSQRTLPPHSTVK